MGLKPRSNNSFIPKRVDQTPNDVKESMSIFPDEIIVEISHDDLKQALHPMSKQGFKDSMS